MIHVSEEHFDEQFELIERGSHYDCMLSSCYVHVSE